MAKSRSPRVEKKGSGPQLRSKKTKAHPILAAHRGLMEARNARRSGNPKKAIKICERLISEHPDYVGALHEQGIAQMAVRNYRAALDSFIRATMLHPDDWTTLASLAQCYIQLEAMEMAARTLEQARSINNDDAEVHFTLGVIYERQREYEAAVIAFRNALEKNPNHAMATQSLGSCLVHLGELEQAAKAFQEAHIANYNDIAPIAASAQLPTGFSRFDISAALEKATFDPRLGSEEKATRTAFIKASLFHQQAMHEEAWEQLKLANNLVRKQLHSKIRTRELFRQQISRINEDVITDFTARKIEPDLPISLFILGVSRSGKTTVERLMGEFEGVKRGYENPIMDLAVKRTSQEAGLLTIASLLELPVELGERFSAQYVAELKRRAKDTRVFTNTHPGRIGEVGLLAKLVPNAKFVFAIRNREDTALRIFMKQYRKGTNAYAYDIHDIFTEIDWYHAMISDWQKRLPDICTIVEYESLVDNPSMIGALLEELCGISSATGAVSLVGDDRGCAEPYLPFFSM